jgi:hypothetical protein
MLRLRKYTCHGRFTDQIPSKFTSNRRLPVCRNKNSEEGFSKDVFEVASYNFKFNFRHNKAAKKFKNYQRMDRKYLFDVLFRTFKENIHLMTQSIYN